MEKGERIWIFCPRKSGIESAEKLAGEITARGWKGEVWPLVSRPPKNQGRVMLGWGREFPTEWAKAKGTIFLNTGKKLDKLQELEKLDKEGVLVPPFALGPAGKGEWLPRRKNHQKGGDFKGSHFTPDYFTLKMDFTEEYRVHVFRGKSIRVGRQFPREDFPNPHPWVKSYDLGWVYLWAGKWREKIPSALRGVAINAVEVLGRDTGAVDLGVTKDGTIFVLEVNSTPALEPNTIRLYADRLVALAEG